MAHILIIEDDQLLADGLRAVLVKSYYRVTTFSDGIAALKWLEQRRELPDLIIIDVLLPLMDGYEIRAALQLRIAWSSIPIIFMVAKFDGDIKELGKVYLAKPFTETELCKAITDAIEPEDFEQNYV